MRNVVAIACCSLLLLAACSGSSSSGVPSRALEEEGLPDAAAPEEAGTTPPADDPGPPPAGCTGIQKDGDGFFRRDSGKSEYVAYVPDAYDGKPTMLLVGLHGCGDDALNFAKWGVAPYATRDDQTHLAISVDGASGGGNCWNLSNDAPKVIAAIEDFATCFYVHRKKVVLGGYSSGGLLAYALGLTQAQRFAGILIENSNLPNGLDLAKAAWKIHIAHRARTGDQSFPIASVRSQWSKLRAAGFPLETDELPGGHDGQTEDWAEWLIPRMQSWKSP